MNKRIAFALLIICLISITSKAAIDEDSTEQVWIINLESSDLGYNMDIYNTNPPEWVSEMIQLTNEGCGEIYVEIFNDPTLWDIVHWIKKQPGTNALNFQDLNLIFDAALTVERKRNITQLLKDMGLKRLALRDNPDRTDKVTIKIYYVENSWVKLVDDNRRRIVELEENAKQLAETSDTTIINQTVAYVIDSDWRVGIGSEATLVDDRFIVVPTVLIAMAQQSYRLSATAGYLPGSETDKKFFAVSLAYFPGDHKLGLIGRLIYASEATDFGYTLQGTSLTLGGILQIKRFDLQLSIGGQRFDDQYQRPSLISTINLGVNYNVLSF